MKKFISFLSFLAQRKKYWLIPIFIFLFIFGAVIALSQGSILAPFIYSIFKMSYVLGISAFYHDSAATLLKNGEIIAAAQEERFTRKKHDSSFPVNSIEFLLDYSKIKIQDIDSIVFYEKPFPKI